MDTNKPVKTSGRKAAVYRGPECLNCGHPLKLTDKYCSNCAQLNTTKQLVLKDFFAEFFSSIFTYDSRLRYTLKDLLFKPGTITKNYVEGQRLKYANPFRFFLSVSIIYFLIQGLLASLNISDNPFITLNADDSLIINTEAVSPEKIKEGIKKGLKETMKNDSLEKNIDSITEAIITEAHLKDLLETKKKGDYKSQEELDTLNWTVSLAERFFEYRRFYKDHEIEDAEVALDSMKHDKTKLNKWIYSKNEGMDKIKKDPWGFASYMMGKIPFFLFFFAPLYAMFFWLIYSKKKYTYMEHLVFIFHIFSFMFLGSLICLIPDMLLGDAIFTGIVVGLIGPFYFYKALRNFYKQSRLITLIKFVLLNFVFWMSTSLAALFFFAVSAAIY